MSPSPFDVTCPAGTFKRAAHHLPIPATSPPPRRARLHFTASVLALALASLASPAIAQQSGGSGAGGAIGGETNPTNGTATNGANGGNGGGGGGGAGIVGGNGGEGSFPGGGEGGTAAVGGIGGDGQIGGGAMGSGYYGGTGGGGGAHGAVVATFPLTGLARGGNGGRGGSGDGGGGGGGGAGGYGVFLSGTGGVATITITGGRGGDGSVNEHGAEPFGYGGAGGVGVFSSYAGASITNTSTITGGAGGDSSSGAGRGGVGVAFGNPGTLTNSGTIQGGAGGNGLGAGVSGQGAAGVTGAGISIVNSGTIAGGMSGDGVTRADAITFTGGANTLKLAGSSILNGNIGITAAGSTVTFDQDTNFTLANTITGLGGIIYRGLEAPTFRAQLTLTGDNTYSGGTTVVRSKLIAASDTALGTGGVVVADGATLQLAGMSGQFANAITINGNGAGNLGALQSDFDPASSTTLNGIVTLGSASRILASGLLTFNQNITGNNTDLRLVGGGRFVVNGDIAIGTGGLTLQNSNLQLNHVVSYTGETWIERASLTTAIENVFSGNTTVIIQQGGSFSSDKAQSFGGLGGAGGTVEIGGSGLTVGGNNLTSA